MFKKKKRKLENTSKQIKMEPQFPKIYGVKKNSSKTEVYSDTDLPQETRKISNEQPTLTTKIIRKTNKI